MLHMPFKIITSPASSGKTTWVVDQVREAGLELKGQPRVVLPSQQQVSDFGSRLALAGGSLGVKLGTIVDLAAEILELAGHYSLVLPENIQIKVMGSVLGNLKLSYYQEIQTKPGFLRACLDIVRELKAGGISPRDFIQAAEGSQIGPRITELGLIYSAYLDLQRQKGWADNAGLTWLAMETLSNEPDLCQDWGRIYLDGFDDLSPVQLRLIKHLSDRVEEFYVTMTGSPDGKQRELVHKRFIRTRELLEAGEVDDLKLQPEAGVQRDSPMFLLEKNLFEDSSELESDLENGIDLVAVPDREAEVRTAFRWIRNKILENGINPARCAILVRDLEPYRGLMARIAQEYHLPVRLPGGLPLAENPLIAAVLKLLRLIAQGKNGLAWHDVLAIWRSPYLNWVNTIEGSESDFQAEHMRDIKQLEEVIRWGRIIQGYPQWEEAFADLIGLEGEKGARLSRNSDLPTGDKAERLWLKLCKFLDLIDPPQELASREVFIHWIENLLGGFDTESPATAGFGIVGQILEGPTEVAERDWRALAELTRIFRELIWAERLLNSSQSSFPELTQELEEVIAQTSYQPGERRGDEVVCAGCTDVRGLSFQAVAVLGLAEGEFPGTIKETPFLRDEERAIFRDEFDLPLRYSLDSAEGEYFYEALTRPTQSLLLTRPRIADNGARWKESPYWEEVLRVTGIQPQLQTTRSEIPLDLAANQEEFLEIIAAGNGARYANSESFNSSFRDKMQGLRKTQGILRERAGSEGSAAGLHNGYLGGRQEQIQERYPEDHVWSASRFESYQTCPFNYFIGYTLGLEKLEPPEEGLDPRQLGNIYHRILERLYQALGKEYTIEDLFRTLPEIAGPILRDAPRKEGFRETAWWEHSQREILEKIKLCLIRLEEIDPGYRFFAAEKRFGIRAGESEPLTVEVPGKGSYRVRGFIDRVDINKRGEIRIIDYKTSGKSGFDNRSVREGKKLQLPLYALAAQEALQLGQIKEGFYFHLLAGEPSSFKLSAYKEGSKKGPATAMERAAERGWEALTLIKKGVYAPKPPDNGCPNYCPAVGFCWQYRPSRW